MRITLLNTVLLRAYFSAYLFQLILGVSRDRPLWPPWMSSTERGSHSGSLVLSILELFRCDWEARKTIASVRQG